MSASRKSAARNLPGLPSRSIELLIVIVIVLILLLLVVPTYLGFVDRAHSAAARSNLASAIPAVDAYYLLHDGSYAGLDLHWLGTFDPGVKLNDPAANPQKQTTTTYCVSATVGGRTWYKAGPVAPASTVAC
jgi:type II secretory pathway pseudopilin PulG